MQNGDHLEKGAILDFQTATKLQENIPVALKHIKDTTFIQIGRVYYSFWMKPDLKMQDGGHLEKTVAILDFQIANRATLIRNTIWTSPEIVMLVS